MTTEENKIELGVNVEKGQEETPNKQNTIESENRNYELLSNNNLNFLNDEDKNATPADKIKKFSFFEQNMKYKLKINIDYSDIDKQKSEISPKMLFKKRKLEAFEIKDLNLEEKQNNLNNNLNQSQGATNSRINLKIKGCFEKYLDLVHTSYFSSTEGNNSGGNPTSGAQNQNYESNSHTIEETDDSSKTINNFKFSSLDLLLNPLRQKFVFESWSPLEIALFECAICKYGKNFDQIDRVVCNY